MTPTLALLNQSDTITDKDAALLALAIQTQITRDYMPIWGQGATIDFVPKGTDPPAGSWWIVLLNDTDQASALGYHMLTDEGLPIGKIFVDTIVADGDSVSVVASHEVLEALGDPNVNLCADVTGDDGVETIYAFENCDAVESTDFSYMIAGIAVSDFVTPQWFNAAAPKGSQLDFGGHVTKPLQLLSGGYIGTWTPKGWSQLTADNKVHSSATHRYDGNRWTRRITPRPLRRPSTAHAR